MGNVITVNMNYGCCRTEQYITDQKLYQLVKREEIKKLFDRYGVEY